MNDWLTSQSHQLRVILLGNQWPLRGGDYVNAQTDDVIQQCGTTDQ